jgi:5-methylthioadenosine/S-adenosylhomocysteine deaminase
MTYLAADVLLTLDPVGRIHAPGFLQIEGGVIRAVEAGNPPDAVAGVVERLPGRLVMPGLVNAHTHSPMVLFRGLAEGHSLLAIEGWTRAIRSWEEVLDPDWVGTAVTVSCAEMIRSGTTTFADQYFHMDRIVPAVRKTGLRAALAYGIVELGEPGAADHELAAAESFLETVAADGRIDGWLGPHALFVDNSPDLIQRELALADRYQTGLHIHLSTSGEEDHYCQLYFGQTAIEHMAQLGVLDRRLLAAHCLTLPASDYPELAGRDFSAVLCASACMRAGAPAPAAVAMREAGVHLAIGSDNVANNNSYDLFQELRTLAKLLSFDMGRPAPFDAEELLRMATLGGAQALGLDDQIGTLEVGKQADLIALDLEAIGWAPHGGQDWYTALVYAVDGGHVTDNMVGGDWLYRDGDWVTLDYAEARRRLEDAHAGLRQRRAGRVADAASGH